MSPSQGKPHRAQSRKKNGFGGKRTRAKRADHVFWALARHCDTDNRATHTGSRNRQALPSVMAGQKRKALVRRGTLLPSGSYEDVPYTGKASPSLAERNDRLEPCDQRVLGDLI
ncbi:hypothetical protein MPNT_20167 [Candidatus Methylacidithermus pantelleriae]|uniref:Uncharacterized protein n=1 Tax=Candidatus Methylacidithermus pantelleriae TaxID=2744239 RepID=A0A8J2BMK0_9BACT|nr:hypothetical protein MPNT_20167 [Candidatus Methylacidithermus pantelleriae]